jgi:hypothetical protein
MAKLGKVASCRPKRRRVTFDPATIEPAPRIQRTVVKRFQSHQSDSLYQFVFWTFPRNLCRRVSRSPAISEALDKLRTMAQLKNLVKHCFIHLTAAVSTGVGLTSSCAQLYQALTGLIQDLGRITTLLQDGDDEEAENKYLLLLSQQVQNCQDLVKIFEKTWGKPIHLD